MVEVIALTIEHADDFITQPFTPAELRARVDKAQILLLGRVVEYVAKTGALPPLTMQTAAMGRQFFRMHEELAELLEPEMRATPGSATAGTVDTEIPVG